MIRTVFWTAALALFFQSSAPAAQPPLRDWTLLGWFSADDEHDVTIEEAQVQNMDELARVGSSARCAFVVQADRGAKASPWLRQRYSDPDYRGAKRYFVEKGNPVAVETLGEVNMGDPKALLAFLEWAAQRYPAKRYVVVFNSHGSGTLSWSGPGSVADSRPGRVRLPVTQYVAYDDTDGDCLTIFEIAATLERFARQSNRGRKVDMVAFDSCMAATVEALYEMRDSIGWLAGTESLMPGEGLNYRALAQALDAASPPSPPELGEILAKSFITRAEAGNVMAVFGTAHAEDLAAACSGLARELHAAGRESGKLTLHHRVKMDNHGWDLESIARAALAPQGALREVSNGPALVAAGRKLLETLKLCRSSLRRSGALATSSVGGLSIQWPDAGNYKQYRAFYKSTSFAKATLWDEFLDWRELGLE